jgi:iron(III) transport system permease protein
MLRGKWSIERLPGAGLVVALLALPAVAIALATSPDREWSLLGNSLLLAVGACLICLPVASLLALLLFRTDVPGRGFATAVVGAMLFVPLYLQAAAWDAGFGLQGWFSLAFAELGAPPILRGWYGATWVHALAAIPWAVLILGASLRLVPSELEEQALLDATPARTLWHITLPRVSVAAAVAALWILVTTSGEMTVTDIFQVRTFAEELYVGFALGDWAGDAGAEAQWDLFPVVATMACLVAAALAVFAHLSPPDSLVSLRRPAPVFRLGRWRWPAAVVLAIVLALLVGVPIGNLLYKAGVVVQQQEAGRVRGWSIGKAQLTLMESPSRYWSELMWSLQIAAAVAILTMAAAVPLAWLARRPGWRALAVLLVLSACLALPGPVIGLGIIGLLNQREFPWLIFLYDRTIFAPCLAMWIKSLPLVTMIMWYALRSVPREMLDAAQLDGAGPVTRLLRIALPQRTAMIVAGLLVAVALAMGDLAASILVVPPGVTTLAIRIFTLIHYGVEDQPAGICLCLFAFFVLLAGGTFAVFRWRAGDEDSKDRVL